MQSIVIFFNEITNLKSDLHSLTYPNTRNILVTNPHILAELDDSQKLFFEKIHLMDHLTFKHLLPVVKQYLNEVNHDNLYLVTNDEYCTPIVGQLIDELGLQGEGKNTYTRFIDKIIMKDILNSQGIRTPYHQLFDKTQYMNDKFNYTCLVEKKFNYPFVLKPVSLYGAKDVNKITNRDEWLIHAEDACQSDYIFQIEEFISGKLFHCDALVKDSKILFTSISEYIWPILLFKQGYSTGSILLSDSDTRWNKLYAFHQQVITALQPPDGATHCELFLSDEGEVVFLEIAARPSGALVVASIENITGVNIELSHFNLRLRRPVNITPTHSGIFSLFCYVPKIAGEVISIQMPTLKSEAHVDWNIKIGDIIAAPEEDDILFKPENIAATILLKNTDFNQLYADFILLKSAKFFTTADHISS